MPGNDIDLVSLNLTIKDDFGNSSHETVAQLCCHDLHIILVQAQFPGNLSIGEVQTHEVQAQNPDSKGLVVSCQNRPGQIVKPYAARLAQVALPIPLGLIVTMADHGRRRTGRATHALRPSQLTDKIVTPSVIDQSCQINQRGR